MRQVWIQVPEGGADEVLRRAAPHEPRHVLTLPAAAPDADVGEVVLLHVSNGAVQGLLEDLRPLSGVRVSFAPSSVLALDLPREDAAADLLDVEAKSPLEIWLAGQQSVGSFTGLVVFSIAAGIVVWIGLTTETSFLLTASMLIAPFAGPAMNSALGTAAEDGTLLLRSVLRYAIALGVAAATTAGLTLLLGPEVPTGMMLDRGHLSATTALLPLAAGTAGALTLVRAERDNLVSGAAIGMLVAASLAPPTGLVGIALALGELDLVAHGAFVVVLQLVAIHTTAAIVFRIAGLGRAVPGSRRGWFVGGLALGAVTLALLVAVQLRGPLDLERATVARQVEATVQRQLASLAGITPLDVHARFTEPAGWIHVRIAAATDGDPGAAGQQRLREAVMARIDADHPAVVPLVDLTLIPDPTAPSLE